LAKDKKVPIAVTGGETLLGRELLDLLGKAPFAGEVTLYTTAAPVAHKAGEPDVMPSLADADLKGTPIIFLAGVDSGDLSGLRKKTIIDVCGVLEHDPEARLRAPHVENDGAKTKKATGIQVIAHPAAIALTLALKEIHRISPIRRSVTLIFEPASERGQAGIEELQKQTVGLLSFKKLPQEIYDAQVSFNLLPRYGEDAPLALEEIELKIERHLASLLSTPGSIPMPSLRLVQAPVFHGYSFSLWVEFENNPGPDALVAGLTSARIDVRTADQEPPTNVGTAGQSGVTIGAITTDRNCARACWLWVVADNFRLAAENAVEVAREALG
jgi:aspartate-semialdehyde dehydrogenase